MARRPHHRAAAVQHDWASMPLGRLSAEFESGGRGPDTVSSGRMRGGAVDPGGVSYGTWQLASRRHRPQEFMRREGRPWASRFEHAGVPGDVRPRAWTAGSPEFSAAWRTIGRATPAPFEAAQYRFMVRTHYDVQARHIQSNTQVDLATHSLALRNVVFSTATQHGPNTGLVVRAMQRVGVAPDSPGYDRALIPLIYAERAGAYAATNNRYSHERDAALRMLDDERAQTPPAPAR